MAPGSGKMPQDGNAEPQNGRQGPNLEDKRDQNGFYVDKYNYWLVVWNMFYDFPYIGNSNPNIIQRGWNHQPDNMFIYIYTHIIKLYIYTYMYVYKNVFGYARY